MASRSGMWRKRSAGPRARSSHSSHAVGSGSEPSSKVTSMTDERFARLLRTIDEPVAPSEAFLDASFETLATHLRAEARAQARRRSAIWWLAAAALLASLVAAVA